MRNFLARNQDIIQLVEFPESLKYRPRAPLLSSFIATLLEISQPIQHQSDFMNLDDTNGNTTDLGLGTSRHPTPITLPATPLSRAQKNNQSPEHTPSSSKVVTFNNVPPQPVTPSKSSDSKKPLEQPQNPQDKKRKQEHLADNFKNSNLILTGYCPQQEEQHSFWT
ncbi:hypothetical protein RclHR1_04500003 [Rhizophagus clarus]|uniref:Uncharacterized protein n=1 Tax=Rhizophagus clarus TaxID=94130 RepID=A0A2Z6RV95_9GLOM|nr:hypothetical protein RclHR1_04500003 [Rhizophagus clarus]